nr:hypothetical protein [Physocyclus mexicanus]
MARLLVFTFAVCFLIYTVSCDDAGCLQVIDDYSAFTICSSDENAKKESRTCIDGKIDAASKEAILGALGQSSWDEGTWNALCADKSALTPEKVGSGFQPCDLVKRLSTCVPKVEE